MAKDSVEDHQMKTIYFQGEKLLDFEPRGHEHMGELHGLGGALYVTRLPDERIAVIDLPGTHGDRPVSTHRHVVARTHFINLLAGPDALDVMQHNRMPHWIGSCAMLTADTGGMPHIHIALCRAKTEFMEQCREALSVRSDLRDLWLS